MADMNKWIMNNKLEVKRGKPTSKPQMEVLFPKASELDQLKPEQKDMLLEMVIREMASKLAPEINRPYEVTVDYLDNVNSTLSKAGIELPEERIQDIVTKQINEDEDKRLKDTPDDEKPLFVRFKPQFVQPTSLVITMEQIIAEINRQKAISDDLQKKSAEAFAKAEKEAAEKTAGNTGEGNSSVADLLEQAAQGDNANIETPVSETPKGGRRNR